MIKISKKIAKLLEESRSLGYFCEQGAVIGDAEFVIYYKDNNNQPYLAHISEFEQQGCLVRLKLVKE